MSVETNKVYLGDGAYAAFDGHSIIVTAEDGVRATDTVCLEPEVFAALVRFAELKMPGILQAAMMPGRSPLANVGTLATTALRTIVADADTQAAMDVEAGVLHAPTARAMFGILRDVVKPFNPQLAAELQSPKTEKARPRE